MIKAIEVFQDLAIPCPDDRRSELLEALKAAAIAPWKVDRALTEEITRKAYNRADVVMFHRSDDAVCEEAGLGLWGNEAGFYVANIVPAKIGKLSMAQYNAILSDFVIRIAEPVTARLQIDLTTSPSQQSATDWLSPDTARKLKSFSNCANKSTGIGHPADEERFFDFVIAAHINTDNIGTDILSRWLHEAEEWDEESAHRLSGDYEQFRALLQQYDKR